MRQTGGSTSGEMSTCEGGVASERRPLLPLPASAHQVQVRVLSQPESFLDREDPQRLLVHAYHAHGGRPARAASGRRAPARPGSRAHRMPSFMRGLGGPVSLRPPPKRLSLRGGAPAGGGPAGAAPPGRGAETPGLARLAPPVVNDRGVEGGTAESEASQGRLAHSRLSLGSPEACASTSSRHAERLRAHGAAARAGGNRACSDIASGGYNTAFDHPISDGRHVRRRARACSSIS